METEKEGPCIHGTDEEYIFPDGTSITCGKCFYEGYVRVLESNDSLRALCEEMATILMKYGARSDISHEVGIVEVLNKYTALKGEKQK